MTGGEKVVGGLWGSTLPRAVPTILHTTTRDRFPWTPALPSPLHWACQSLGDSHSNQSPVPQHHTLHPHLTPCCLTAALLLRACHSHEAGSLTHDRASPPCRGWESLYSLARLPPSLSHFLWLTSSHSAHGFFFFNHFGQNK